MYERNYKFKSQNFSSFVYYCILAYYVVLSNPEPNISESPYYK